MKGKSVLIVALLAATMTVAALAGCSGNTPSSSTSGSSSSPSASSASAQSQDEVKADLKARIANAPTFKSVTIVEEADSTLFADTADSEASSSSSASASASSASTSASSASASAVSSSSTNASAAANEEEDTTISSKTVYKFDETTNAIKTSSTTDIDGIELKYVSDGDKAVLVTDKASYSGTTEQFDEVQFQGSKVYLDGTIGDLGKLVDCADAIEQKGSDHFVLKLDPKAYTEQDELLTLIKDSNPVQSATLELEFDKDGYVIEMDLDVVYEKNQATTRLQLSDFDKTTVEALPEATATYEDMQNDMQKKLEDFSNSLNNLVNDTVNMTEEAVNDTIKTLTNDTK